MDLDATDLTIAALLQQEGRLSATEIARAVGLSVSAANDRLRRLQANGTIRATAALLDPARLGAGCCCFLLLDLAWQGEAEAVAALTARPEVMELHHISGPHSYLMKIRVADPAAVQRFLTEAVKPLPAVLRTETIFSLQAEKETPCLPLAGDLAGGRA
ncbi:Lrp/AsnC family transcriptional regulator, leucine-responsive regulatory protein [Gemmobacter aquatilis]|uniref:Lrp/AsnC family transcriptional regulator, leucine-responsive regulatory protein n=1 Tax=Gemmobacter aquatilis TaxID=933059 RepID=A0A1H8H1U1_9RHOB|nr:Lrp/AsnC family transcriptional regulator [Gemmobacter aquatilis]SEN49990.1 Lrp/AsnC family transcriptional regulator, leucine-responsive regulatory protein [Gemmobacter aquatilis]